MADRSAHPPLFIRVLPAALLLLGMGCGLIGPSCKDETGPVLATGGQVGAGQERSHDVVSPKNSNLIMRLTWTDPDAALGLRATITNCGAHVGCSMITSTPPPGPGGSSPYEPWPPGVREMLVDGSLGKAYRVEVTGDPARAAAYALSVTYDISCER